MQYKKLERKWFFKIGAEYKLYVMVSRNATRTSPTFNKC